MQENVMPGNAVLENVVADRNREVSPVVTGATVRGEVFVATTGVMATGVMVAGMVMTGVTAEEARIASAAINHSKCPRKRKK